MKLTILILFLATLQLSSQDYSQDEYTNWPLVDGDTIKSTKGIDFITIYDPKEAFKEILIRYLEQLPSHGEHETNLLRQIFLEDCDLTEVEEHDGISLTWYYKCTNPDHVIQVKEKPTFEGFINYMLNAK